MRLRHLLMAMTLVPLMACAQGEEKKTNQNLVVKGLMWVKTLIDSMAVANIDRSYIEQPKKPWAVEARSSINHSSMEMEADWSFGDLIDGRISAKTDNNLPASLGAWVGYRGYGFGLSKQLSGEGGTLSLGAMGGSFGINMRINSYRSGAPYLSYSFASEGEVDADGGKVPMDDPMRVRSFFLDGYYMFNGKHFSYAAAYDQSLIQRRSAGSFMAGLMYYHSSVAFDDNSNWPLVLLMRAIGKLKFTQANVGAGYAYNWVPARGWLISAQVMPMISLYNKNKVYYYDVQDDNGHSIYEAALTDEDDSFDYDGDYKVVEDSSESTANRISWNFDARLSIVYNWKNCYLRVYGHYNRFRYKNDEGLGWIQDWTGYASLGIRF